MTTLLLGAGASLKKWIRTPHGEADFKDLTTLDINSEHNPDVVYDLNILPLPFGDAEFDEIHAYEVLEHLGRQGDWRFFFKEWSEYYRILKPGGLFVGSVPAIDSPWVWGDPSHTRLISTDTFLFLDQDQYKKQVGVTPMSDFRFCYKGDFHLRWTKVDGGRLFFVLEAIKPSRINNP